MKNLKGYAFCAVLFFALGYLAWGGWNEYKRKYSGSDDDIIESKSWSGNTVYSRRHIPWKQDCSKGWSLKDGCN